MERRWRVIPQNLPGPLCAIDWALTSWLHGLPGCLAAWLLGFSSQLRERLTGWQPAFCAVVCLSASLPVYRDARLIVCLAS